MSASVVLGSSKSSTYRRGYAFGFDSPAALLDEHFKHPVGLFFCRAAIDFSKPANGMGCR
jgi:hypothetical protein